MATRNAATVINDGTKSAMVAHGDSGTFYESAGSALPLHRTSSTAEGERDFAAGARHAGRVIAGKTSKAEYSTLIKQYQEFVSKEFLHGSLSRSERCKMEMIKWNIERIEDALYGDELDKLEALAEAQQRLAKDIGTFVSSLPGAKRR